MDPLTIAFLGTQAFSAAAKMYGSYSRKKESKASLGRFSESYMKKSPYEQEWLKMLRRRMTEGALPTREMMQQVSRQVGETGAVARQRTMGYAASRGLEDSGAAASMMGRVDAQTLRSIAEQARAIAIQNEMTKTGAEREFGQYAMRESDVIRRLAEMKYGKGEDIRGQYYTGMTGAAEDIAEMPMGYAQMKYYGGRTGQQKWQQQGTEGWWDWMA